MTAELVQVVIGLTGPAALLLLAANKSWGRWGFVVGFVGQPFWLWATWSAAQWGMLFVSLCFTGAYAWGISQSFTLPRPWRRAH